MVEVICQGANLTRIFHPFATSQSPFAEVVLDGEPVGRTDPHKQGDTRPRWNTKFVIPAFGNTLLFKVCIQGALGDIVCGEGSVEVLPTLHASINGGSCSVLLWAKRYRTGWGCFSMAGEESVGFLQCRLRATEELPPWPPPDFLPSGASTPKLEQVPGGTPMLLKSASAQALLHHSTFAGEPRSARPLLRQSRSGEGQEENCQPPPTPAEPAQRHLSGSQQRTASQPPAPRSSQTQAGPQGPTSPQHSQQQQQQYSKRGSGTQSNHSSLEAAAPTPQTGSGAPAVKAAPAPGQGVQGGALSGAPPPPAKPGAAGPRGQMSPLRHLGVALQPQQSPQLPKAALVSPAPQWQQAQGLASPHPRASTPGSRTPGQGAQRAPQLPAEVAQAGYSPAVQPEQNPSRAVTPEASPFGLPSPTGGGRSPRGDAQQRAAPQRPPAARQRQRSSSGSRAPARQDPDVRNPPTGRPHVEPGTPSRLGMDQKRKSEVAVLMQSKDMMQEYAGRPFRRPEVRARGFLESGEFKEAVYGLLGDFGIAAPPEEKLELMFKKHRNKGGPGCEGVTLEEYEALLFRLLCFMLATGEVGAVPQRVHQHGGEGRDSNWREVFLRRNTRPIHEVYDFGKKLGSGSFGAVYLVTHRTELKGATRRECVCKVISKAHANASGLAEEKVREEFAVLKRLDHPHVLRIYEDFEDDQSFYIVMEPCRGGDLENALKEPITSDAWEWERWVAKAMKHTLEAIAYCHARGVIHKDLKPENVMLLSPKGAPVESLHVVVVDFGIAEAFQESEARTSTIAGTPPFMAPEVWAGNFGKACDVWAVGVMVFYLLSGRYPFVAQTIAEFPRAVAAEPHWDLIGGATPQGQYACWQMLCKTEAGRPSAQQLLQHAWFTQFDLGGGIQNLGQTVTRGILGVARRSNFERFVGRLVATQLDAGQLSRVNEAFKAMDTNNDGMLSRQELQSGLMTLGAGAEDVARVVDEIDVGRTGRVSYTEFLAGVTDLRQKSTEERDGLLWLAWQQFGPDQNGMVRTADIQTALAARGMTVAEMPQAFMQQLRKGASGAMTFESFKSLFQADESCWLMSSLTGRKALSGLAS